MALNSQWPGQVTRSVGLHCVVLGTLHEMMSEGSLPRVPLPAMTAKGWEVFEGFRQMKHLPFGDTEIQEVANRWLFPT